MLIAYRRGKSARINTIALLGGRYRKRQTKSNIIGKEAREEEEQDTEAYDITQWGRGRRG